MPEEKPNPEKETHRKLAVDLFNYTWKFLDQDNRTVEENDEMLHATHASRFHWGKAGTAVNLARGEWQVSRVYAVLKRPQPALYHARRCLEICQQNGIGNFDIAFAYEALVRASFLAGDQKNCQEYLKLGQKHGEQIAEKDDRDLFFSDLKSIQVPQRRH